MPRFLVCVVLGSMLASVSVSARAELPSLMSEGDERRASASERPASLPAVLRDVDAWRRGRIYLSYLGAADYRLGANGLEAGFYYAGASMRALIGYGSDQRLELVWPVHGGSLKLAYVDADGESSYRIEFVQDL